MHMGGGHSSTHHHHHTEVIPIHMPVYKSAPHVINVYGGKGGHGGKDTGIFATFCDDSLMSFALSI